MILEDLLWTDPEPTPPSGEDVFTDPELLVESSLVGVHLDALSNQVAALIDLRTWPSFGSADTAVVMARGVTSVTWEAQERSPGLVAWTVLGFDVDEEGGGVRLQLDCHPDASLTVLATAACFVIGTAPGIGPGQPDYEDGAAVVRARVASWRAPFLISEVQRWQA